MDLLLKMSNKKTDAEMLEMIAEMERKLVVVSKKNLELTKKIDSRAAVYRSAEQNLLDKLVQIDEQISLANKSLQWK